uniref:Myb/SANT-like domain-containing protein n=1 Tax=Arundo donax TaxID=35708 RepID=A0A0A9C9W3_ARUDO
MDLEQHGDSSESRSAGTIGIVWSNAMSSFVLAYLYRTVANGTRTSSGFKQVHLNACAKALNEQLSIDVTGNQIANHLRKWKKLYKKIQKLKNLSATLWDENTCTIRLDPGHYNDHVKVNKDDANFLNTPLEHYNEMATIFGNAMATGKYAKGGSDPLATDVIDLEKDDVTKGITHGNGATSEQEGANEATASGNIGEATTSHNIGVEFSGSKPAPKRAKITCDDDLGYALINSLDKVAKAIEKGATPAETELLEGLYDNLMSVPGFEEAHLVHYYAYLCENVVVAKAFNGLSLDNKKIWVARYIKKHL